MKNKADATKIAKQILPQLLRGKLVMMPMHGFPHLPKLVSHLDSETPGMYLQWGYSKYNTTTNAFSAQLLVLDFQKDPEGNIYFKYDYGSYWKIATTKNKTEMWVKLPEPTSLKPCLLKDIIPLIPHIHKNIWRKCPHLKKIFMETTRFGLKIRMNILYPNKYMEN